MIKFWNNIIKPFIILFVFLFLVSSILKTVWGVPTNIGFYIGLILYCLTKARKNIIWAHKPSTIKSHYKGELSNYEIIGFIFGLFPSLSILYIAHLMSADIVIWEENHPWQSPFFTIIYFVSSLSLIITVLVLWGITVKFVKSLKK